MKEVLYTDFPPTFGLQPNEGRALGSGAFQRECDVLHRSCVDGTKAVVTQMTTLDVPPVALLVLNRQFLVKQMKVKTHIGIQLLVLVIYLQRRMAKGSQLQWKPYCWDIVVSIVTSNFTRTHSLT